jgi:hypothetical protein
MPFYSSKSIFIAPAQEDKQVTFLHLYLLTWILLVLATVGITHLTPGLGGGYLMSAWNVCVGLSCVIACVADVAAGQDRAPRNGEGHYVANNGVYEELEGENVNEGDGEPQPSLPEPDESTPLIQHPAQISSNLRRRRRDKDEEETLAETWWWIPQFIISVPVPVILLSQVAMLLLDAMPQTLGDGSSAVNGQFHL